MRDHADMLHVMREMQQAGREATTPTAAATDAETSAQAGRRGGDVESNNSHPRLRGSLREQQGQSGKLSTWARRGTSQVGGAGKMAGKLAFGVAAVGMKQLQNTLCNFSCCGYRASFGEMEVVWGNQRSAHMWRSARG